MKLSKKKVFALALAVCLIAILSMGTLAWFTDSESVTNNFLIADSTDTTADDIFSVDVWEDKDGDGVADDEIEGDTEGLIYEDILPGDKLTKVAYVENTGYYDQYIRVTVTLSDATAWINALGVDFVIEDCLTGFDATMWNRIDKTISGEPDTITYVLYYNGILDGDDEEAEGVTTVDKIVVFEGVKIPTSLTQAQAAAFKGGFAVDIVAEAVQTENLNVNVTDDVSDAYEAFKAVGLAN